MSMKLQEKAMLTDRTEHRAIITLSVDSGKTSIETKQIIEEIIKHRNILRSLIYKWQKRLSDEVCDCTHLARQ